MQDQPSICSGLTLLSFSLNLGDLVMPLGVIVLPVLKSDKKSSPRTKFVRSGCWWPRAESPLSAAVQEVIRASMAEAFAAA